MQEEEFKVINNVDNLLNSYKENIISDLVQEKLEEITSKENNKEKYDCFKSNIKLVENFLILIFTRTSKCLSELNSIKILGFEISIIKLDILPGEEKSEINISIPLKEPKTITIKNILAQKYFFVDFIKISENKNYFHICVFDQLHIYKIYIKDNKLKYNKIELKKFNEKTKVLYLGECFHNEENLLEIDLLLKPMNNLMILEIRTDETGQKIEEKIYEFKNMNYNTKNIFHKYLKSFCGKFLFIEKETDDKFLIYKDNNDIVIKKLTLDISKNNDNNNYNNNNHFLYTYENDLFLLSELPKENIEQNEYIILGIFNLFYNKEKDVYESKLMQKIIIKNEGRNKDYLININIDKDISIQTKETLFYIQLGKFSSVEKVYKLNTNAQDLQISKIICSKFQQWFILLSSLKENLYLSKLLKDDCNYVEKLCIKNYENNKELPIEENVDKKNNDKIMQDYEKNNYENKNEEKEKYSQEKLEGIISHINEHIDKIINEKIEQNKEKFESIKQQYANKFEMLEQDILAQKKENELLEKKLDEILNRIGELDDANKENIINNENIFNNDINNLKILTELFKNKNNFNKNDMNNNFQFMRRMNLMKSMNPFNFIGGENMFNNQIQMNDPRMPHFFNNGFMNQVNCFNKK